MALTVDYSTAPPWLITVAKSDLTLITGTQYQLTVDAFWHLLADYTDNENTMPQPELYSRIPATSSTPSITSINLDWYVLEFEDGLYSVNIVNGNTNIREAEVKNQVSVNTNNTTGFIDPKFLEAGLFNEKVTLDVVNGVPLSATGKTSAGGIIGTPGIPVDNLADAKEICITRGFNTIEIRKSMTFTGAIDFSDGFKFVGSSPVTVAVTVDPSVNITNCEFWYMQIAGTLDGGNVLRECIVGSLDYVNGFIYESALIGPLVLAGGALASIIKSWSFPATTVVIDMGGSSNTLLASGWSGDLSITNCTGGIAESEVRSLGGYISIENTVTAGVWHIHGETQVTDNSSGTADVHDHTSTLRIEETWRDRGFDIDKPLTITDTQKSAGGVVVSITDTGTSHILQRQ